AVSGSPRALAPRQCPRHQGGQLTTDPSVKQLLAPLAEDVDDVSARRVQVDRDKIIARMVEVSLAPEERFSPRLRWAGALALAASVALAAWGGSRFFGSGAGHT